MKGGETIMKKVLMLSTVFMLLAVSSVSADTAKNKDTGYRSFNLAKVEKKSITKASTYQAAFVANGVSSSQNTGGNIVAGNTKVYGAGGTGDANTTVKIKNDVNNSYTEVNGGCGCESNNKAVNDQTGAKSVNIAVVENKTVVKAETTQEAVVVNEVQTETNTGGNIVVGNTVVVGGGSTGDATTNVTIRNDVNDSTTLVNAGL